jgi:phosphatidylserine/phosphatidylglycerophosphate/cardiolipin synthase-like enzyme
MDKRLPPARCRDACQRQKLPFLLEISAIAVEACVGIGLARLALADSVRTTMTRLTRIRLLVAIGVLAANTAAATAQDRLCDPGAEDCRSILIDYIRNEQVGIDVAFWFMEDARYATELIRRHQAGVPVRVLIDPRANTSYPLNAERLGELQAAGIPMRRRVSSYILHWKMMLFHGQNVVEFSGANYSANAWIPLSSTPYANYIDEAIYFTSDTAIVDSFRTKFDDQWVDTVNWTNYANVAGTLARHYGIHAKDPSLNFPPAENYRTRSTAMYGSETWWIDAIMYRITDRQQTDAILAAVQRGVTVRLITEQEQYRDRSRLWHAWNVDRLYMGGVQIKHRGHAGLNHQKSVILYGRQAVIFGSSNWTSPSAAGQLEHNMFTTKPYVFTWFTNQFTRKWNNYGGTRETIPFAPLPPDAPTSPSPANNGTGVPVQPTLHWIGGPWAHTYDIYLGTDPSTMTLYAANLELGPSESASERQSYDISVPLQRGATYYWQVVGRTMAMQTASSPVWRFTVTTTVPPAAPTLVSPGGGGLRSNPTFIWNAVNGATHYQLWIEDGTSVRLAKWFGNWAVGCATGSTCAHAPLIPLQPGAVTWWVQAWGQVAGFGAWSAPATYTQLALERPVPISPGGTLAPGPGVTFMWNAVAGATHHYLWVTDSSGVVRVQRWYSVAETGCTGGGLCTIRVTPTLSPGTATWWVQAWNVTTGYSPWSGGVPIVRQ